MENQTDISSQYPSVDLAYDFVKSSYDAMINRFESANSRIQSLLTWAIGITAIIPLFNRLIGEDNTFKSVWFIPTLATFVAMVIVGVIAQRMGGIALADPKVIYEKHLQYSQWEFKKNQVFYAGKHFHLNAKAIETKCRYIDIMMILFALEIVFGFISVIVG